jgi:hypothetical protein
VLPRSGDVLHVTRAASVQFTTPILFRVIRALDRPTYDGWVWLDGYQLNSAGEAVELRSIFVQVNGLRRVQSSAERTAVPRTALGHGTTTRPTTVPGSRNIRPVVATPRPVRVG